MRHRHYGWLCFVAVCIALSSCVVSPMLAQAAPASNGNVNLELKDTEVRSAIEALFRNSGKNFSIDSSVQGTIAALSIHDVPFDSALKSLAKSAGLVYRLDGGVYIIGAKPIASVVMPDPIPAVPDSGLIDPTTTEPEVRVEKISLNHVSASEILSILAGDQNRAYGGSGFGYPNQYGSGFGYRSGMGSGMGYGSGYSGMGYGSGYSPYGGSGYGSRYGYGSGSYGSGGTYSGTPTGYGAGVYNRGW